MNRRRWAVAVLAALIGSAVGLVVAGLPDFEQEAPRPSMGSTTVAVTTATVATEVDDTSALPEVDASTTTSAPTTTEARTTTTQVRSTTTTDPSPRGVLSGVRVDVINSGSPGGTASAVAERLSDEFGAEAVASDGPSVATSYVASTAGTRRAAEVVAFLLGIDEVRLGELDGPDRLEVILGRDYRE